MLAKEIISMEYEYTAGMLKKALSEAGQNLPVYISIEDYSQVSRRAYLSGVEIEKVGIIAISVSLIAVAPANESMRVGKLLE